MRIRLHFFRSKISITQYKQILLFIYLCFSLINTILSKVLSVVGLSGYSETIILTILLGLYFLLCIHQRNVFVPDFWLLYACIIVFFLLSILFHPEYEYWYTRSDYGVLNYVLRPNNGIFIYLFLRLVGDPRKIIKTVKLSGWFMYLLYSYNVIQAIHRGYWVDLSNYGYEIHLSYNLTLGYNVLLYALVFLYCALEEKKTTDLIGAAIGFIIILIAGSRGPFLDIAVFIIIYMMLKVSKSRKKVILLGGIILGSTLLWILYPFILQEAASILNNLNLSSRLISKLQSGTVFENTNRIAIWSTAIDMIRKNPLGYGAMGSRHVLHRLIYVAHPHQVFLEILIDFGVIIGSLIILGLFILTIKVFRLRGQDEWKAVFLIFFARACQLLVSITFWHSIGLWSVLAIGICTLKANKKGVQNG